MTTRLIRVSATALLFALVGCRGNRSAEPPIHLQQNMDFQPRFEAQERNAFFADQRAMRPTVPGTVARGELRDDDHLQRGLVDGQPAQTLPMPLTAALLARGQQRFDIYCAVCHSRSGEGKSVLLKRNMRVPPPAYSEQRLRQQPVGYLYQVIADGVRNMPSYASQIPVRDRWAIAAYVRALQLASGTTLEHVPADIAAQKGWRAAAPATDHSKQPANAPAKPAGAPRQPGHDAATGHETAGPDGEPRPAPASGPAQRRPSPKPLRSDR